MFKTFLIFLAFVSVNCGGMTTEDQNDQDSGPDASGESDSDVDSDSDSDSDTDTEGDTSNDTDVDTDSSSYTDSDSDSDTDSDTGSDSDTATDTETATDTDSETDSDSDTSSGADSDSGSDSDSDSDSDSILVCDPGETQLCYCVGAGTPEEGVQVCEEDGLGWSACECRPDCPWDSGWPCPCMIPHENWSEGIPTYCGDGSQCSSQGLRPEHISSPSLQRLGVCSPVCVSPEGVPIHDCAIDNYEAVGVCLVNHCFPTCGADSDCPPDTICYDTPEIEGYPWNVCRPMENP